MIPLWLLLVVGILCLAAGVCATYFLVARKASQSKNNAAKILENAYAEAKTAKKEAILEAKEEIHALKEKCDAEIADRYNEITKSENRLTLKEEMLIKKEEGIDNKVASLDVALNQIKEREVDLQKARENVEKEHDKIVAELEKVASLTRDEAKRELIDKFVDEAKKDCATKIRQMEQEAQENADKKAKEIVTLAVQKCATNMTSELTVTVVPLIFSLAPLLIVIVLLYLGDSFDPYTVIVCVPGSRPTTINLLLFIKFKVNNLRD